MAIQRAAPMPVPPEEAAQIRGRLAKDYGAEVWEGPERRVLLIRVPRDDPDPVNDVEAAVEYLQPDDVEDVSHCLLMGEQRVAQVYVRPLQDLMRERIAFDHRQAEHWRQELPGQLSHTLFQAPDDPRRRWRLAVRLPCGSVAEAEEEHFDDLVEGIGPLLETARFKQVVAVYLISGQDHVRIDAKAFLAEMKEKWVSEERIRRKESEERKAQDEERTRAEAERRRQETDRVALLREVDRKMARFRAEKAVNAVDTHEDDAYDTPSGSPGDAHVAHVEMTGGLLAESESMLVARPADGPRRPSGPWTVRDVEQPETTGNSADDLLARAAAEGADVSSSLIKEVPAKDTVTYDTDGAVADLVGAPRGLAGRLDALRARVDSAIDLAPTKDATSTRVTSKRTTSLARGDTLTRRTDTSRLDAARAERRAAAGLPPRSPRTTRASLAARGTDAIPDAPRGGTLGRLTARLEACGFDVMPAPATNGHTIDLAAERADGDPQRVVARIVPRLDVPTAKQLLKTARELDVDLVLCVAEHVDGEAARMMVATKIKVASPQDVTAYRF